MFTIIRTIFVLSFFMVADNSFAKTEASQVTESKMSKNAVLIFVSFSMPPASLTQWFNQAEKIQAPLIIRGLVNQSFQQTQTQIHGLLTEHSGWVILDPHLFDQYQINQVPAVVVRDTSTSCSPDQSCIYPYDIVYGNVNLEYALQTIAQRGDNIAIAQTLLQKLRENGS
ncbi:MAG TPA: type-F conjugative transfer system pilin assembly protein TrbC [Gammaproteobacteria bacterium]|nr:type-F conjugative transfer system pilin assembly protein TrbC [Gammaproteobacteria bacterium]